MQTYILFNSNRTRKDFVHWAKFKKDIFPLVSDSSFKKEISEEQIAKTWTPEDWKKFLNRGKAPNVS